MIGSNVVTLKIAQSSPRTAQRHLLVYVLHSSNLYGTERMALATSVGLKDQFDSIFIAPPGDALVEAARLGFGIREYRTSKDLARVIRPILAENEALTFVATGPRYSLVCIALNLMYRRRINQIQMIHGGAGEDKDYARKKWLNNLGITFVTVSDYCRQRLIDYGVRQDRIEVVYNYLRDEQISRVPRRPAYSDKIRNILIVSRVDPVKRVDMILDAMDRIPALRSVSIRVLGDGEDLDALRERARRDHPNVKFAGFTPDVAEEMSKADLLVHTCPIEPFGLVILEAMAAGIPVLVPDQGGAFSLIEKDVSGFSYGAEDSLDLGKRLLELLETEPDKLNEVVAAGRDTLARRFTETKSLEEYRRIFSPVL